MSKTGHTERESYRDLGRQSWAGDWMRKHRLGDRLPRGKRFAAGRLLESRSPYGELWKSICVDTFPVSSESP